MHCPICSALERENMAEGEAEATATLKRRSEFVCSHHDIPAQNRLDEDVLRSRKRQAHIAFELHEHRTKQHPTPELVRAASR
jgi:hypothetical protein